MPKRLFLFVARISTAALLLTSVPFDRSLAGHSLMEAWNEYQGLCDDVDILNRGLDGAHRDLSGLLEELNAPPRPADPLASADPAADAAWDIALRYANEFGQLRVAAGVADIPIRSIPDPKDENIWDRLESTTNLITLLEFESEAARQTCDDARQHYEDIERQHVTALAETSPLPDPAASTPGTTQPSRRSGAKPPRRRRRQPQPVKTTRKPQKSEHSYQATNVVSTLFGLGLSYGLSRGSKRRKPPGAGRPGGRPGCAGGGC